MAASSLAGRRNYLIQLTKPLQREFDRSFRVRFLANCLVHALWNTFLEFSIVFLKVFAVDFQLNPFGRLCQNFTACIKHALRWSVKH